MAIKHPLDPQTQWDAAARCGKLVAQGILTAEDIVPQLVDAAVRAGYRADRVGLQSRLTWHVTETADHWRRERDRTEFVLRRELQPMLAAFADGQAILKAAHALNDQAHAPLLSSEVKAVVEAEMAALIATLRRQTPQTRRRRHAR